MEILRIFWEAAIQLDPGAARLDEGLRFPICRPEALMELFSAAGLCEIDCIAIDLPARFADFDDYWQPFLGGQGPAPSYLMSLGTIERRRLRERIRERLPFAPDGSISLLARAWAVRGSISK